MRFGSVCSGIEAASVAWNPLGWEAAWFSEIEPFPCGVLAHHYPEVPNYGDMTALPQRILSGEVEAPDLFCGGTPCQAFSVAGNRRSLDDERGNLSLTFCEIANAIDDVRSRRDDPACIVFWENVPAVLNTPDNAFGCFLAGIAGESEPLVAPRGRWTNAGYVSGPKRAVAWRVTDAQYFGVAQRRKRVFVVASARDGFDPAEILFEFEGVRRDIAPSREKRQEVAATITARFGISRKNHEECITLNNGYSSGTDPDVMATLCATDGDKWGCNQWVNEGKAVLQPTYGIPGNWIGRKPENGGNAVEPMHDVAPCLTKTDRHGIATFSTPAIGNIVQDDVSSTMTKNTGSGGETQNPAYVMQPIAFHVDAQPDQMNFNSNTTAALTCSQHAGVMQQTAVRRLTPVECERLQGFPDNYTNIPWRKQPGSPDGPRYKALGNSWAVSNVLWIGARIQSHINNQETTQC